jgi:hypothetical protein
MQLENEHGSEKLMTARGLSVTMQETQSHAPMAESLVLSQRDEI